MSRRGFQGTICLLSFAAIGVVGAQESCRGAEPASISKAIADRAERGTLHDAAALIRGDTGRWQDAERWTLAPAPPVGPKNRLALDDHLDQALENKFAPTAADDVWLLCSTRQLNDNDRVWVERVERSGNRATVVITQATWRGKYFKNFTGYHVFSVNLGKLDPGNYEVECVLQPATFTQFEGDGRPQDAKQVPQWPKDDQPTDAKPLEWSTSFTVAK